MKKIICVLLVALLTVLSSCSDKNLTTDNNQADDFTAVKPQTEDSILLINRFTLKMVSYNTKTFTTEISYNNLNDLVYEFDPCCKYYTAGNSSELGFAIFELNDKSFYRVMEIKQNEGIFPLAYTENHYFFIKYTYDEQLAVIDTALVEYIPSKNQLVEFKNINGLITEGTVIGDILYYTVYDEKNDYYTLYSVLWKDKNATPKMEKNLECDEIYSQNGELFISNKEYITSETKKFKKESENYFIGSNFLVQYQIQKDAGLYAILTDTQTGEKLFFAENIVDFKLSDSVITFYCEGAIKAFDLINRRGL